MSDLNSIVNDLNSLTIPEVVALTKQLEEAWGVKAAPPAQAQRQEQEPPKAEQTEFSVILNIVDAASKMNTIKAVRELLAIGLKEAKDFVEAAPKTMKEGISKEEAQMLEARLKDVGATCLIK